MTSPPITYETYLGLLSIYQRAMLVPGWTGASAMTVALASAWRALDRRVDRELAKILTCLAVGPASLAGQIVTTAQCRHADALFVQHDPGHESKADALHARIDALYDRLPEQYREVAREAMGWVLEYEEGMGRVQE